MKAEGTLQHLSVVEDYLDTSSYSLVFHVHKQCSKCESRHHTVFVTWVITKESTRLHSQSIDRITMTQTTENLGISQKPWNQTGNKTFGTTFWYIIQPLFELLEELVRIIFSNAIQRQNSKDVMSRKPDNRWTTSRSTLPSSVQFSK